MLHPYSRAIVKFRRNHEYRMVRRPAHKEDFLAAIKYELHLDLLRKQRKKVQDCSGPVLVSPSNQIPQISWSLPGVE